MKMESKRLLNPASSSISIPCSRSSCGRRSCQVPKLHSLRVGQNHLHSQFPRRPSHLRQTVLVHFAARLRRQPEIAPPIAVWRAEPAFALDYFPQRRQHRPVHIFFQQLRVVDLARGIIQNDDQVVPTLVLKPAMPGCHRCAAASPAAGRRARRLLWMPRFRPFATSPAPCSTPFHPAVTELHLVLAPQLLVKCRTFRSKYFSRWSPAPAPLATDAAPVVGDARPLLPPRATNPAPCSACFTQV